MDFVDNKKLKNWGYINENEMVNQIPYKIIPKKLLLV